MLKQSDCRFWAEWDPRKPVPENAAAIESLLRRAGEKSAAEFLEVCSERTAWRHLPQITQAIQSVWTAPAACKTARQAKRAVRLAHMWYLWGQTKAAKRHLNSAARINMGPRENGMVAFIMGKILLNQNRLTEAYRSFRAAERLFGKRFPREKARLCSSFGYFYRQIGEPEKARYWFEEGIACLKNIRDTFASELLYANLGNLHREIGRYDKALGHLKKSRTLAVRLGDIYGQLLMGIRVAETYRLQGRDAMAIATYESILSMARRHPEHRYGVHAILGLVRILAQQKKFGRARQLLSQART